MVDAGSGRRTVALGVSLLLAAAGIACLVAGFETPARSPARPTVTDVPTVSLEGQAVIAAAPARTESPAPSSMTAVEPVPAAAAEPADVAEAIERLLFDASRPLSAAELDALVVAGRFARADVTLAALRRLILDARGSERLVAPGEAAAALRADPARSLAVLELAAEYADVPTESTAHARLRELLDAWPPALGTFVALLAGDANDVERLASNALASGGDANRDALAAALAFWTQRKKGVESSALVRALFAAGEPENAARILAAVAEGLGSEPMEVYEFSSIIGTARRRLGDTDSRCAEELFRLATESESAGLRRFAIFAFIEGRSVSTAGREFAESVVRDGRDLLLVSQAMSALGPLMPPSDLIELGKRSLRGKDASAIIASSLGRSVFSFPHERPVVAEFVRATMGDGSMPVDFALVLAERLRLTDLSPDIEAIASDESAPDEVRSIARSVLDRLEERPPEEAPSAEPPDAATVTAVRAAESSLERLRLEGRSVTENWDREESRFVYAGESEWTAHYSGTPGGRERVHFHARVRPWSQGPAPFSFSEEILADDGRVLRTLDLRRGTPEAVTPSRSGRQSSKGRSDDSGDHGTGWSHTLFGLGKDGTRVSDLLLRPGYTARRDDDGRIAVEPPPIGGFALRLDPRIGYAVVMSESRGERGQIWARYEVHEFRDAGEGIHFPARATRTLFGNHDTPRQRTHFECRLAMANETSWGDEVFRLDFPDGTSVDDQIAGGRFVAGSKPDAPEASGLPPEPGAPTPAPVVVATASSASEAVAPAAEPPPAAEPTPSRAPWLATGIALLAAAAVFGGVSRRSRGSDATP